MAGPGPRDYAVFTAGPFTGLFFRALADGVGFMADSYYSEINLHLTWHSKIKAAMWE
jgi:hypothetical protein